MFTIIPPTIEKESDEPFCEYCLNQRASEIAVILGKQQESEVHQQAVPSELEVLTQRNQLLEDYARQQTKEFVEYRRITEERFEKLTKIIISLNK